MDENEFEILVKPLIEWINENCNPHTRVLISSDSAELLDGHIGIYTDEFLKD